MTHPLAPDLADAAADFAGGRIDASQFCELFERRTVYGVRLPGRPVLAAYLIGTDPANTSPGHGRQVVGRPVVGRPVVGRPVVGRTALRRTVAPVFSSLAALARWCCSTDTDPEQAQGVDWFALTGGDLLDAWPSSCALVIDPGSEHCIAHPRPLRVEATITVRAAAGLRAG